MIMENLGVNNLPDKIKRFGKVKERLSSDYMGEGLSYKPGLII